MPRLSQPSSFFADLFPRSRPFSSSTPPHVSPGRPPTALSGVPDDAGLQHAFPPFLSRTGTFRLPSLGLRTRRGSLPVDKCPASRIAQPLQWRAVALFPPTAGEVMASFPANTRPIVYLRMPQPLFLAAWFLADWASSSSSSSAHLRRASVSAPRWGMRARPDVALMPSRQGRQ